MDKPESHESEQQLRSNSQTIIESMSAETPEQRVATNVSQQLLSNAFESQIQTKQEKDLHELESQSETGRQTVPIDVFDQHLNQNIVKPPEQTIINTTEPLGIIDYEQDYDEYEEEEEDEDSLEREPNNYESRAAVNEANIGSDLLFTTRPDNQSNDPFVETEVSGNEELLYQLSDDSSVLRAQKYGIGSDLRIDSQTNPNLVYELNSEDPFQTPEKKVGESQHLEEKYTDLMSGSDPFETVSTDFGISSTDETNNLLDLDINSPQIESDIRPISHSIDIIEVKRNGNHSQTSSESEDDNIAYDNNEESYVVTSCGEVSSLPTHTFAETVTLNDSITSSDSKTTNRNDIEFSSTPNLDSLQTNTSLSERSIQESSQILEKSSQQEIQHKQDLEIKSTKVEKKDLSEIPFVPIVAKTMAKTQESKPQTTTSGSCDTCTFGSIAELVYWRNPKNSGIVFGSGLVLLLSLTFFSIISVVAYASLAALSVTLSFRIYKNILQAVQKTNEGHPFKEYLEVEITPSNERIHQIVDSALTHLNCTLNKLRSVFLVEDIIDSLKFVVLFWCLTYIGSWFNGLTLIILAYLALFSLPKVYEMNKTQVDHYLNLASTQINDITSKVRAKIPFPAKKDKEN